MRTASPIRHQRAPAGRRFSLTDPADSQGQQIRAGIYVRISLIDLARAELECRGVSVSE